MKLLHELFNAPSTSAEKQIDLKTADGSKIAGKDLTKGSDARFSLLNKLINKDGVDGSQVTNYLELAQKINDDVDSVVYGLEVNDNQNPIKVYVNAIQADQFEQSLGDLLGYEENIEVILNTLAQTFDIVDIVWPTTEFTNSDNQEMADEAPNEQNPEEVQEPTDELNLLQSVAGEEPTPEDEQMADASADEISDAASSARDALSQDMEEEPAAEEEETPPTDGEEPAAEEEETTDSTAEETPPADEEQTATQEEPSNEEPPAEDEDAATEEETPPSDEDEVVNPAGDEETPPPSEEEPTEKPSKTLNIKDKKALLARLKGVK